MSIRELEGNLDSTGFHIGIVVARWNSFITDKLLQGALEALKGKGVPEGQLTIAHCPGAYEIPLATKKLLEKTDGVVALGAVIRGDTPHFEYVCDAVNKGVLELNLKSGKPVTFGVLTTDNVNQATERSGVDDKSGNKGAEAALALLEMLSLVKQIEKI